MVVAWLFPISLNSAFVQGNPYSIDNNYDDGPLLCFNGPKTWQLGWFSTYHVNLSSASGFSWTGTLVGFAEKPYASQTDKMIVRIESFSDTYINFNRRIGMNVGTLEGADQVLVTTRATGTGYALSYLVAKLSAMGVYTIPNFNGTSRTLRITVNSIVTSTTPARAGISIDLVSISTSVPSSKIPTRAPTLKIPTRAPTLKPTTRAPTAKPTTRATAKPTARAPTAKPSTRAPTAKPTARAPTAKPSTRLTPEQIACNFLSVPNLTKCRSKAWFDSYYNYAERTTGSTIPSEIGLLTQLTYLDFSYNRLTSTIPSEIALLTKLSVLSFYKNQLTSTIPSEFARLTQLTYLGFGSNQMTSTIPSEIGLMTQLTRLSFYYNYLTGTIPSSLCAVGSMTIVVDCGEIACGCCISGVDYSTACV
jgi:hypothetical protein